MKKFLLAAASVAAVAATGAQAATYAIDPNHTAVIFEVDHFGATTNRGRFPGKEGKVEFDRAAKTGKADIVVDVAALNTGVAPFNKHLMSADFFNSEQNPTARFVADKFSFNGDKVSEVAGQLTLLGKTHPVTLKATKFNCYQSPILKREVCGGDFETTIKRSLWGVNYGLNFGFQDDIKLIVQIEAVNQSQQ